MTKKPDVMRLLLRTCLAVACVLGAARSAWARGIIIGPVRAVYTDVDNTFMNVKIGDSAPPGTPPCNGMGEFTLSLETTGGRATLAILLAAQAQGLMVHAIGRGECSRWPDREDLEAVSVVYP